MTKRDQILNLIIKFLKDLDIKYEKILFENLHHITIYDLSIVIYNNKYIIMDSSSQSHFSLNGNVVDFLSNLKIFLDFSKKYNHKYYKHVKLEQIIYG